MTHANNDLGILIAKIIAATKRARHERSTRQSASLRHRHRRHASQSVPSAWATLGPALLCPMLVSRDASPPASAAAALGKSTTSSSPSLVVRSSTVQRRALSCCPEKQLWAGRREDPGREAARRRWRRPKEGEPGSSGTARRLHGLPVLVVGRSGCACEGCSRASNGSADARDCPATCGVRREIDAPRSLRHRSLF